MKRALSTALILGSLYGTANAAPITSPIYMPEAGKILGDLQIGYTTSSFDKTTGNDSDKFRDSMNIHLNGKVGIIDKLSINYGLDFDFIRKLNDLDLSAQFSNFYLGVTGRVVDAGINKLDVILNIGQEENPIIAEEDTIYVDLAVRYGLELDIYNLGFSINGKYINDNEALTIKTKRGFEFGFALDNEFIITDTMTIGLDLYYKLHDKIEIDNFEVADAYSTYGFNLDANYAFNSSNYLGIYFGMDISDLDVNNGDRKDPTEYKFGLKMTSQF